MQARLAERRVAGLLRPGELLTTSAAVAWKTSTRQPATRAIASARWAASPSITAGRAEPYQRSPVRPAASFWRTSSSITALFSAWTTASPPASATRCIP